MNAYDVEMLTRPADREDPPDRGWCFGLPPGITAAQWPLDPNNGYPMVHGFTLLLPEDYRCHGPEIVALSFFGTPDDMNDGGPEYHAAIQAAFAPGALQPVDPELAIFWQAERQRHPRLHRMEDGLGCAFAVILLTQEEYTGNLCRPPQLTLNAYRDAIEQPKWLTSGAAFSYWTSRRDYRFIREVLGEEPAKNHEYNLAIRWKPRRADPNAGVPTCDTWHQTQTGYQQPFYWLDGKVDADSYRLHEWGEDHQQMHIGGTMRPIQNVPLYSPFHIGFEEFFGGYNFAVDGNAQLDFKDMKFDWACG